MIEHPTSKMGSVGPETASPSSSAGWTPESLRSPAERVAFVILFELGKPEEDVDPGGRLRGAQKSKDCVTRHGLTGGAHKVGEEVLISHNEVYIIEMC